MENRRTKKIGKYLIMVIMMYIMAVTTVFSASAATIEVTDDTNRSDVVTVQMLENNTTASGGFANISNWLTNVTSNVKNIGYGIAILCVVGLGIVFITGGGQALQKGKGWAIGILVGVAVLSFGASLIASLMTEA